MWEWIESHPHLTDSLIISSVIIGLALFYKAMVEWLLLIS
jgi:hypothetical protein